MTEYRYTLDRSANTKFNCPDCGMKSFTPYIDTRTNAWLDEELCGICSRMNSCAYHYPPREFFKDHPESMPEADDVSYEKEAVEDVPINLIDLDYVNRFLHRLPNNLIFYLKQYFEKKQIDEVLEKYLVGFVDDMIIFWQIDFDGDVRTGKVMKYGSDGKRVKRKLYLAHTKLYDEFNLEECYFGEHLLSEYPEKEVMIVESEKTCLICAMAYPEHVWISTGGKLKYMESSWPVLSGRDITLIPDQDAIEEWYAMKDEMEMIGLKVELDDICKVESEQSDIADLVIKRLKEKSSIGVPKLKPGAIIL